MTYYDLVIELAAVIELAEMLVSLRSLSEVEMSNHRNVVHILASSIKTKIIL